MRAVMARAGSLSVEDIAQPVPLAGQVLARSVHCGICGSDLHALQVQAATAEADPTAAPAQVYGHEFCAEILDYGPGTDRRFPIGSLVCSVPILDTPGGIDSVGYSQTFPGGYSERIVLQEHRLLKVPAGLSAAQAALTEPLAVGVHAVAQANLQTGDVPLVIGCGPVGLAVISGLKVAGIGPIVAADFSPARRRLAELAGADVVIDPAVESPYTSWTGLAGDPAMPSVLWNGSKRPNTVVFECVGVPGMLAKIIEQVPVHTRLVVVGVCMAPDTFLPLSAILKELSMTFVLAYRPDEFERSLHLIADGKVNVEPWVTGHVGLDGVAGAFRDLASPDKHCKVLVSPGL
ncbi:MAG: zinc-binding dehydrogenase [Actinomycetota bacterium]